jgi:hypothetical protein
MNRQGPNVFGCHPEGIPRVSVKESGSFKRQNTKKGIPNKLKMFMWPQVIRPNSFAPYITPP